MDTKKTRASSTQRLHNFHSKHPSKESRIAEATNILLHDGKQVATELYEEGLNKIHEAQHNFKEYPDEIVNKVHNKPFLSLLIAGGLGFLLAALFKRS